MSRIALKIYANPSSIEAYCRIRLNDGSFHRFTAVIDTGAEISLFPSNLLPYVELHDQRTTLVAIEQAGIAKQTFEATQANVLLQLEDLEGNLTRFLIAPAWFTDTEVALIGFENVLDQCVLHIDMPARDGWLQLD